MMNTTLNMSLAAGSALGLWRRFVGVALGFAALSLSGTAFASGERAGADIDTELFLNAISQVETGGNSRAIGRKGERGMYQFSRQTWQQHSSRSFHDAHNPGAARVVARAHFEWLMDGFRRNGRQPSAYLIAAAWNAGLSRTLSGRVPSSTRNYAQRVTNIVAAQAPRPVVPAQRYFVASTE